MQEFNRYARLLGTYLRPQRARAMLLAVTLFAGIGLQLVPPQILRSFIDTALTEPASGRLVSAALLFLGVGFLIQIFSALTTYLGAKVGWTATNLMREDVARHCLNLDMAFHNERTPGEMIERIDGDITHLSNFFSQLVIRVLGGAVLCAGVLLLVTREDWRAGLVLTVFAFAALLVLLRYRSIAVPSVKVQREASARLFGFMEEKLAGLEDIRANAGGPYVLDRFYRVNHRFFHTTRRAWMMHSVLWMLIMGLFIFGDLLALGMGVRLHRAGVITLGTVFLFFQYADMLRVPIQQVTRQIQDLQNAVAGIARVDELLNTPRAMTDGTGVTAPARAPSVEFERVWFAYHRDEMVLKDLTFKLECGHSLGLIGRTGSGKTTIARMLFRLYEAEEGVVRVGGADVKQFQLPELRRCIGMVTQDVQLFQATVRDNLTFFNPGVSDARMHDVIDRLGLGDWYARLPRGLDTELAPGGAGLSAGEAQLLAFTRIFLRDPGLVILDEPSSRMDPATERWVKTAIRRLVQERTAIVIAHRLSTLQMVDEIMLIDDGRLVEAGPRRQLADDPASRFHQLLNIGLEGELA